MKKLSLFLAAAIFLALNVSAEPVFCDTYYQKQVLKTIGFFPIKGEVGIYHPGVKPELELVLQNLTGQQKELAFELAIQDYYGKACGTVRTAGSIAPEEKKNYRFTLPAPASRGSFMVTADILADGVKIVSSQTCFSVLPPVSNQSRDPFFCFDKNGMDLIFLPAGKLMGIGMISVYTSWVNEGADRDPVKAAKATLNNYYWKTLRASDFKLCIGANSDLRLKRSKKEESRRNRHLFPRDDSDYEYCRVFYETLAAGLKGRAKFFFVGEEFDAHILGMLPRSQTQELANYVLIAKNVYAGIKKGNPESTLAVLGICMSDYFLSQPPFRLSRMVLHDLGDSFDYLCFDAYSGNYNGANGPLIPPERDFRKMLFDCADLSVSYNRPYVAFNVERCYGMDYYGSFNSRTARDMADYTARSLIIAKSAPCAMYSIHLTRHWNLSLLKRVNYQSRKSLGDFGLWKHVPDLKGRDARIPRPVVPAIATTAHELAFAESPKEQIIDQMLYCYSFTGGGKNTGKTVAALWTTQQDPLRVSLDFPAPVKLVDLMGNARNYPAGKRELILTGSPVFAVTETGQKVLGECIAKAQFKRKMMFTGYGRLKDRNTMTLNLKNQSPLEADCRIFLDNREIASAVIPPFRESRVPVITDLKTNVLRQAEVRIKGQPVAIRIPVDFRHLVVPFADTEDLSRWLKVPLRAPKDVFPAEATMPERGHFLYKGQDPFADVYLSWNKSGLQFAVEVTEKKLIQRQTGWNIWMDDCIQFGFLPENDRAAFDVRLRSLTNGGYNFAVAKTSRGVEYYRFYGGKKGPGTVVAKASAVRSGNKTFYRFDLPWSELSGFQPKENALLGFGLVIFNNENEALKKAPYQFQTSGGITNGADGTELSTIILGGPKK